MRYCGRPFTTTEVQGIRQLIVDHPAATRARLSRLVCEQLGWRRDNGRLKDMSCRVALLRMQDDGLLQLPPPRNGNNNGKPYLRRTRLAAPQTPLTATSPKALGELQLQLVTDRQHSHLYNEYMARYHYLGYQPLPGAQLRYFIRANDRIVALLGFGAAAWKTQPARPVHRLVAQTAGGATSSPGEQRPLPHPALGPLQKPRVLYSGHGRSSARRRLATSIRMPARIDGDLR